MKKRYLQCLCLPLACLVARSACAPGGGTADAEPLPIEVPPPVEQTNEGLDHLLHRLRRSWKASRSWTPPSTSTTNSTPTTPVTADKGASRTGCPPRAISDAYTQMTTEVMAGEGPDLILLRRYNAGHRHRERWPAAASLPIWSPILRSGQLRLVRLQPGRHGRRRLGRAPAARTAGLHASRCCTPRRRRWTRPALRWRIAPPSTASWRKWRKSRPMQEHAI